MMHKSIHEKKNTTAPYAIKYEPQTLTLPCGTNEATITFENKTNKKQVY